MKTINISLLSVLFVLITCCSCNRKVYYEDIQHIPNETWNIDSALVFTFEVVDSLEYYNFYINLRNTVDFETQNFYLFMKTEFPGGYVAQDTLGCIVCDKYGKWTGKGMGRIKDNKFLFKPKVRFMQKGTYTFTFYQAMREENVLGVSEFGMSLFRYDYDKLK